MHITNATPFLNLSTELHLIIGQYLSNGDFANLTRTCRGLTLYRCELYKRDAERDLPEALEWAVRHGQIDTAKRSLEGGTKVNFRGPDGYTLLHRACKGRHSHLANFFLEEGADINATSVDGSALHIACLIADKDMVRHLLHWGCDVGLVDPEGNTAVHIACTEGHVSLITILLDYGANVEQKNNYGFTPFAKYTIS